jgi:hypothetical protein
MLTRRLNVSSLPFRSFKHKEILRHDQCPAAKHLTTTVTKPVFFNTRSIVSLQKWIKRQQVYSLCCCLILISFDYGYSKTNSCSAGQEILHVLYMIPPMSQIYPLLTIPTHTFKIYYNVVPPSTPAFYKLSLPITFPTKTLYVILFSPVVSRAPRFPSHSIPKP